MGRDFCAYRWDGKKAIEAIWGFVEGKTFDDYACGLTLRSAVERQFEIIDEALNQLSKVARRNHALDSKRSPDRAIPEFAHSRIRGGQ